MDKYQDEKTASDVSSPPPRPQIHYCRSPNMETFTCWWRFPDNPLLGNGNVTYVLTYAVGKGSKQECPDYTTGGPNSCYFDSQHTQVWEVYCMNVTAISARGNQTSEEHCLDVAEIVETDPPLNLTYQLMSNSEESGSTVVVSWQYPLTVDVQMGWVTLIYELQFRHKSEPHNWKVKGGLREPHLELLDLPVGSYVVRVRCKSRNAGLWSKWSSPLTVDIPAKQGIGTCLSLSSGKVEEINRLFSSFHGYTTPQYSEEVLLQVSMDEGLSFKENSMAQSKKMEGEPPPSINGPGCPRGQQPMQTLVGPTCYSQALAPYWQASTHGQEDSSALSPTAMPTLAQPDPSILHSELLTFPALGYSMILSPAPVQQINQDFYTCVNGINARGAVHLVPCLPDHSKQSPYSQIGGAADSAKKGLTERSIQLTSTSGQGEPVANVVTAGPGSVAVGTAFDSYATLDDLRLHNEQCVGMASSQ
ncbi:prolactin receptor-like [Scleropages formosus]|uniref:Prolactin receptor-like n=1 Tax=Scleropages formosus TaxID=113540 RepID=A0A0N8K0M0_SCLFO|nr:prolactin receptor-like [Scleropages formosus]